MKFSDDALIRCNAAALMAGTGAVKTARAVLDALTEDDLVVALASMLPAMRPATQAIRDQAFEEAAVAVDAPTCIGCGRESCAKLRAAADRIRALKSRAGHG